MKVIMHKSRRESGTGFASSQGGWTGSRGNNLSDGSEFHFCHHAKMEADSNLLKNYKSSLKFFGGYSEDDDKIFSNDKSFLRFLSTDYLPEGDSKEKVVELNLKSIQTSTSVRSNNLIKNSENLFQWIVSNKDNLTEVLSYETKFVFLKEVFSKLLRIPYRFRLEANFYAVYLDGIIYLLNEKNLKPKSAIPQSVKWNRKFRRCVTNGENDVEGVAHFQFYRSAVTAKLGPHNLLFTATTDCFNADMSDWESHGPASRVLLQCWKDSSKGKNSLEKYEKYQWIITLATMNIPYVLVGLRNKDGVVNVLKLLTQDDLSHGAKDHWDINVGFTFAKNVLSFIEETTKKKPGKFIRFVKGAEKNFIKAEEVETTTNPEKFPPESFIKEFENFVISIQSSH